MCIGNGLGFSYEGEVSLEDIFGYCYGGFLLEVHGELREGRKIGTVLEEQVIAWRENRLPLESLNACYEAPLEDIYRCNNAEKDDNPVVNYSFSGKGPEVSRIKNSRPERSVS